MTPLICQLLIYVKNIIIFKLFFILQFLDSDFIQPKQFLFDAIPSEIITIRIDIANPSGGMAPIKFETCYLENLEYFFSNLAASKISYLNAVFEDESGDMIVDDDEKRDMIIDEGSNIDEVIILDSSFVFRIHDGQIIVFKKNGNLGTEEKRPINLSNFMWLKVTLGSAVGGLPESLQSEITKSGYSQVSFVSDHLKSLSVIVSISGKYYAPFTSFIQSSGFGKTKLSRDILLEHPGIYTVFRRTTDSGVPKSVDWMVRFGNYVKSAPFDDAPNPIKVDEKADDLSFYNKEATDYCTGRVLLALREIINSYLKYFEDKQLELVGAENNGTNYSKNILCAICEQFFGNNLDDAIKFSPDFSRIDKCTYKVVIETLMSSVSNASAIIGTEGGYPFLFFLDEFDVFNELSGFRRLPALNIFRRALHMLNPTCPIMVVAIGTNSDALDFTPSVRDNSLRSVSRKNILPPFILSGNFDIFSEEIQYHKLVPTPSLLLNRAFFNVLVSFGRAIWSSCKLYEVISIAMAKLKNGYSGSAGSRLALLLVRANLSVNVHHVLARTLIKSYMTIVSYVSTDARDMKIGYSSEPVLAMASREILKDKNVRVECLQSIKIFLLLRALDKGRLVEALFEYLILFALDDAFNENGIDNMPLFDDPDRVPNEIKQLCSCSSFLLETRQKEYKPIRRPVDKLLDYSQTKISNMRPTTVRSKLKSFLNVDLSEHFCGRVANAITNCTHFQQLETLNQGDFGVLENVPKQYVARHNVIDVALLKCGLMRNCGFIMPPNYFGIDFIIPIMLRDQDGDSNVVYSFIAFQSKSVDSNIYDCAQKMSATHHLVRCPIKGHYTLEDCEKDFCQSHFELKEIREICENQLTILLMANSGKKLDNEITHLRKKISDRNSQDYPSCLKTLNEFDKPLSITSWNESCTLSVHTLEWDFEEEELLQSVSKKERKRKTKEGKEKEMNNEMNNETENPKQQKEKVLSIKFKRKMTCLAVHDICHFEHLVTKKGVKIINDIINFSNSNFDEVDSLHLPIVQNSFLNGMFCPYIECNKLLRLMKDLPVISDPLKSYKDWFSQDKLEKSILACIVGPVDKILPELSVQNEFSYSNSDSEDVEMKMEMEID